MREKLIRWLIKRWMPRWNLFADNEEGTRLLIKKRLPGFHLSKNPKGGGRRKKGNGPIRETMGPNSEKGVSGTGSGDERILQSPNPGADPGGTKGEGGK